MSPVSHHRLIIKPNSQVAVNSESKFLFLFPDNLYKLTGQTENVETLLNFDCLVAANKLAVRDGDDYI